MFRFLHIADVHLGSPFAGLSVREPQVAERFARATRDAFSNLVDRAIAEGVAFVVIAGDLYDGAWRDAGIGLFFNRQAARLDRAGIRTFVIRGNHDAESVVRKSVPLPDGVESFGTAKATTIRIGDLKVALHGQSYAERAATENLAASYPAPVPGHFNIGVLHTSLAGHAEHETYAPCSLAELVGHGYDYWALGHIHAHGVLNAHPHVVFAGNVQGRHARETGPKGAVLVTVADGTVTECRHVAADVVRWASIEVDATGAETWDAVLARVGDEAGVALAAAGERPVALRVRVVGETRLAAELSARASDLRTEVEAVCQHGGDVWIESVRSRAKASVAPPLAAELTADPGFDLASMLDEASRDARVLSALGDDLEAVLRRLPGDEALDADLPDIVAEARDLVRVSLGGDE